MVDQAIMSPSENFHRNKQIIIFFPRGTRHCFYPMRLGHVCVCACVPACAHACVFLNSTGLYTLICTIFCHVLIFIAVIYLPSKIFMKLEFVRPMHHLVKKRCFSFKGGGLVVCPVSFKHLFLLQ